MEITNTTDKPGSQDGTRFPTWFEIEARAERFTKIFGDQQKAVYSRMCTKTKKLKGHYLATDQDGKRKLQRVQLAEVQTLFAEL